MQSFIATVYDRDRNDPNARALREFEVIGNRGHAMRAAANAASVTLGARDYRVERA